ncbi:MAG: hypothetical protein LBQ22_01705 [Bacteroidales bacterium]|jgi:hypothetical protein|nr:hypothetical protein [Bacteroidales bacterium]
MNKNIISFLVIVLLLLSACNNKENTITSFKYPKSKIWAHNANDTLVAQTKEDLFNGLEIDLVYSEYQDLLFVGHDLWDTIKDITFDKWLSSLKKTENKCYWLDVKNINIENAEKITTHILDATEKFKIKNKVIIESPDHNALQNVKNAGLAVLLWVDNFSSWENKDTVLWKKIVTDKINILKPDAISCFYHMYPLLSDSFPEMNVHYWNTPIYEINSNIELTKELCRVPNVKVVLVDYDEPIKY